MTTDRKLGPIGDRILFENERVRVWGVNLEPGQRQPWHKHDLPYLIVPLTKGKNIMFFDDGREKETNEAVGEVLWREPGIHQNWRKLSTGNSAKWFMETKGQESCCF